MIFKRTEAGQEKYFEIQLPSGPVHFSFQFLPLKYYLHNGRAVFLPYQLNLSMLSTHCFVHPAVLSFEIIIDSKLSLRRLLRLISIAHQTIRVPRGRTPFGQHQESRPLARSVEIPVLIGFANTIDRDRNQSDLSDLTLSMRRVTGSP